jgi:hypothetical protein
MKKPSQRDVETMQEAAGFLRYGTGEPGFTGHSNFKEDKIHTSETRRTDREEPIQF